MLRPPRAKHVISLQQIATRHIALGFVEFAIYLLSCTTALKFFSAHSDQILPSIFW